MMADCRAWSAGAEAVDEGDGGIANHGTHGHGHARDFGERIAKAAAGHLPMLQDCQKGLPKLGRSNLLAEEQ